ncbi:sugar transferase [Aquicoccus sp. G2-2]|uniref:sugar transferase n=1 Tax=Aquicoccus sp. G2-2 TaxID=3092120 RepID=UPI002ADF6013|nr:sugar transferase [Aquicoccus sp. G2-2]MEA1115072.1 sugar transferase [Aquicoccus sp. G2-2]
MYQIAHSRKAFADPCRSREPAGVGKRVFDVAAAVVLLLLTLPLTVAIAGVLWAQGGGIFFRQRRVGHAGRMFDMWKFRSMQPGAERRLAQFLEHNPALRREWAQGAKLSVDPRVTRLGVVLRRYSLDELPQLWNVLRGDMSLVGPRPVPGDELRSFYGAAAKIYCAGRPGLTGLWQVSGRNALSYEARVMLDLRYRRDQGVALDLWIIWRTIHALVGGTGR